jgi:hypothetical protein
LDSYIKPHWLGCFASSNISLHSINISLRILHLCPCGYWSIAFSLCV